MLHCRLSPLPVLASYLPLPSLPLPLLPATLRPPPRTTSSLLTTLTYTLTCPPLQRVRTHCPFIIVLYIVLYGDLLHWTAVYTSLVPRLFPRGREKSLGMACAHARGPIVHTRVHEHACFIHVHVHVYTLNYMYNVHVHVYSTLV